MGLQSRHVIVYLIDTNVALSIKVKVLQLFIFRVLLCSCVALVEVEQTCVPRPSGGCGVL